MLSRTVEDTGTVTSPLVPWNSCGAYMTGVLGVATIEYLPFAFFNLFNPLIALAYAFTGFRIERIEPAAAAVAADDTARRPNGRLHSLPKETVMRVTSRQPETERSSRAAGRAGRAAQVSLHAAVRLHDPVRAHRPHRDRDLDHPGRPATPSTPTVRRSPAPTKRSSRARRGSSSTRSRRRSTGSTASRTPPPATSTCSTAASCSAPSTSPCSSS